MKHKIAQLMKSEGLTSSRLAEILEIQPSGVSHLVSGRNKPGFDLLQKILRRFPKINPYWLLLDDEQMYLSQESNEPTPPPTPTAASAPSVNSSEDPFVVQNQPIKDEETVQRVEDTTPKESSIIDFTKPNVKRVIVLYDDGSCESYTIK